MKTTPYADSSEHQLGRASGASPQLARQAAASSCLSAEAGREALARDPRAASRQRVDMRAPGADSRRRGETAIQEGVKKREQQRIGQQLHDDLGGVLTGLKACIAVAMERAARAGATVDPLLADASLLAEVAFDTVRKIATNLRPAVLEQMGMWTALECNASMLARRSNIHCELQVAPSLMSLALSSERELTIYRIVCEALTNVERHAHASRVLVSASESGGAVNVTVADDGIGFQVASCATLGVAGMKERARAAGGTLTVSSGGVGTLLRLILPHEDCHDA
jgi:two-component system sensor histidine kinase UhpB